MTPGRSGTFAVFVTKVADGDGNVVVFYHPNLETLRVLDAASLKEAVALGVSVFWLADSVGRLTQLKGGLAWVTINRSALEDCAMVLKASPVSIP